MCCDAQLVASAITLNLILVDPFFRNWDATDILSALPQETQRVVSDLGFGGLVKLPKILLVDRRFSLWLLSRVCTSSMSLRLGNGSVVPLTEESVQLVLG
ncbi:hypothetical protein ACP4OV_004050 [Aristida adscensionis]